MAGVAKIIFETSLTSPTTIGDCASACVAEEGSSGSSWFVVRYFKMTSRVTSYNATKSENGEKSQFGNTSPEWIKTTEFDDI
jgi:hypothetical protein